MKQFKLLAIALMAVLTLTFTSCGEDEPLTPEVEFIITEVELNATDRSDVAEIVGKIKIKNSRSESITLEWVRENVNVPNGWETAVCDHELCYPESTNTRPLLLTGGQEIELKMNFYPNNVAGNGSADLIIYKQSDRTNSEKTVSFTATAN